MRPRRAPKGDPSFGHHRCRRVRHPPGPVRLRGRPAGGRRHARLVRHAGQRPEVGDGRWRGRQVERQRHHQYPPFLESAAAALAPGQSGLVALDWWNGNRSILADAGLSGVIAGLTLQTGPAEIYRALMESIAYGNQAIMDNFAAGGLASQEVIACGGIAEKSLLLMQMLADVSGLPVKVPASSQVPARGAALFGAVAAGPQASGYAGIVEAAKALRPGEARAYDPDPRATAAYRQVYGIYKGLHDNLGRGRPNWLHELKRAKAQAGAVPSAH